MLIGAYNIRYAFRFAFPLFFFFLFTLDNTHKNNISTFFLIKFSDTFELDSNNNHIIEKKNVFGWRVPNRIEEKLEEDNDDEKEHTARAEKP